MANNLNTREAAKVIEMPSPDEPWVGPDRLAEYLDFAKATIVQMAEDGAIPGHAFRRGKKTYWRFKISEVDRAMRGFAQSAG